MNELLGRLTNLSYEFFGVLLPGFVANFLIVLWLAALGPCVPAWTAGTIPLITLAGVERAVRSATMQDLVGLAIPSLALSYFFGHLLVWLARNGKTNRRAEKSAWHRIGALLTFRVPKPTRSYSETLESTFQIVRRRFIAPAGEPPDWRQFYPPAKCYLSQNLSYSLVSTYQNKYTLHRSLALMFSLMFWACVTSFPLAWITSMSPHWAWLGVLTVACIILLWGFASSYMLHWEMFGNTIITETYALLYGPTKDQAVQNEKV